MIRPLAALLLGPCLACASSGGQAGRPSTPPRPAASRSYDARFPDPGTPLEVHVLSTTDRAGVSVIELTYAGAPGTAPVRATLVRPPPEAPHGPAVLWVHWLGEPASSNHTEYLEEAVELARTGAVSLLPDALWSQPDWYQQRTMDADPAALAAQVVSLRRGLELLSREQGVNPGKLAVVGHDFGGMTGLLAAAADGRPRCQVLVALTPRFEHWMFYDSTKRPTDEQAYRRQLAAMDPIDALPAVEGPLLVQLAQEDFYVSRERIEIWHTAVAAHGGELRLYASSHAMELPQVRTDRLDWLRHSLGLGTRP
jgi:dienelactone hydrolase